MMYLAAIFYGGRGRQAACQRSEAEGESGLHGGLDACRGEATARAGGEIRW